MKIERDLIARWKFAQTLVRLGGDSTLPLFQQADLAVDLKEDQSPVTAADRNAEQLMRVEISRAFPHDGVLGEEFGECPGTSGYRWVLDPIDGTKSFITGVPLYGTMVGLESAGAAVCGAIYFPALQESIHAAAGQGCYWTNADGIETSARVATKQDLAKCTLLVSDARTFASRDAAHVWETLEAQVKFARTWGDCYGYYLVATGRADIMIDPRLSAWDAVAAMPIICEAGGRFTDWQGRDRTDSGDAFATNPAIWPHIVALTRSAKPLD